MSHLPQWQILNKIFAIFVKQSCKKSFNIGPQGLYYKTLRIRKWTDFVVSCDFWLGQIQSSLNTQKYYLISECVDYESVMFYRTPGSCIINPFLGRNLRISVISQSVCPWKAFLAQSLDWKKLARDSSLIWKSVNYVHKKFYDTGPQSYPNILDQQVAARNTLAYFASVTKKKKFHNIPSDDLS